MKRVILMSALVAAAVGLSGCMDTVNTAENADKTATPEFVKTKHVVTDSLLSGRIKVLRIDKQELPTGLLRVQVTVRSTRVGWWDWMLQGDHPYKIEYRFHWMNQAGMNIDTATSVWVEKDILPGDTEFISAVAPNPQCKDFILKMRESHNDPY